MGWERWPKRQCCCARFCRLAGACAALCHRRRGQDNVWFAIPGLGLAFSWKLGTCESITRESGRQGSKGVDSLPRPVFGLYANAECSCVLGACCGQKRPPNTVPWSVSDPTFRHFGICCTAWIKEFSFSVVSSDSNSCGCKRDPRVFLGVFLGFPSPPFCNFSGFSLLKGINLLLEILSQKSFCLIYGV